MPGFQPFAGVRYAPEVDLDLVVAPPYDVIDPEDAARLRALSPQNAVRVELPEDGPDADRYTVAGRLFRMWLHDGVLLPDPGPSFYAYRMTYQDEGGRVRTTTGVVGAMELVDPDRGDVLPHERTMPKPKGDRLSLIRACRANTSPIWGLSLAAGLSSRCPTAGVPAATATDEEGVRHEIWPIDDQPAIESLVAIVGSAPVVIADGHHRYETALAYRDERRGAGDGPGGHDHVMALVVELAEDQLAVRPIHRLVSGLPEGVDLPAALASHFTAEPAGGPPDGLTERMAADEAVALIAPDGAWLLRPRPAAAAGELDLDSARLDRALAGLPAHELAYRPGWREAADAVSKGEAQAAFLVRPAAVAQIAAAARDGVRMPPKTTYFWPKPRTGMVFRPLD